MRLLLLTVAVAVAVAGCGSVFDLEVVPELAGGYARTLTVAQRTTTGLVEFPLSVTIENDPDFARHVIDGSDIGFLSDGEPLPCEVVAYDAATGTLDTWVRVPLLPATPETLAIQLVYGAAREPCTVSAMWSGDYRSVFHGELDGDRMRDRSPHGHDVALLSPSTVPAVGAGSVGPGLIYDGLDDSLCEKVDADGSLSFGIESFSFSAWVLPTALVGDFDSPVSKGGSSMGNPGFAMQLGNGSWNAGLQDGVMTSGLRVKYADTPTINVWHHLVTVVDRKIATATSYINGVAYEVEPITGWGSFSTTSPLCIGDDDDHFTGMVDEVRITAGTRSAQWIEIEHANVVQRDQLIQVGPERSL